MLSLEVLPARHGDSLLVSWGNVRHPHRLLIDAGPTSQGKVVAARLREFPEPIDLLIVTHIDADHIGGVLALLKQPDIAPRIKAVWFNGYEQVEAAVHLREVMLGVAQGEELSRLIKKHQIPWNVGWPHPTSPTTPGPVVRLPKTTPPTVRLPGRARLTVLSPTPERLAALQPDWFEIISKAGLVAGVEAESDAPEAPGDMLGGSLEDLAALPSPPDRSLPNGSSIVVVFSYAGKRLLLAADGYGDVITEGLEALGAPYRVDVCKLPHHGSRGNVTQQLVAALDTRQWIFSSNGEQFHHPHAEALARVVLGSTGGPPVLYGNYNSEDWGRLQKAFPPEKHGYELQLPPAGLTWPPSG